jgi:hypothetical protein
MNRLFQICGIAAALLLALASVTCERPTAPPNANTPPQTRLANIPQDGSTVFALVALHWDAGDFDGYIVRYQYRYFTYHRVGLSTTWTMFDSTAWKDTTGTTVTIPFNSTDSLNKQIFYVRAIDNDGNVDPNPAQKLLYTTRTAPPRHDAADPCEERAGAGDAPDHGLVGGHRHLLHRA